MSGPNGRQPEGVIPLEAELATLGVGIQFPDSLGDIFRIVHPDDFGGPGHKAIAGALFTMRGEAIDILTLTENLRAEGKLEDCGGPAYIASLTSAIPTSANISYYATIVHDAARKRRAQAAVRSAAEIAFSPRSSADDIESALRRLIQRIDAGSDHGSQPDTERRGFHFVPVDELELRKPQYSVENLFETDTTVVVVGAFSTFKTFLAIDIGCSKATGTKAFGHDEATHGPVFMIIGEGRQAIRRRFRAWEIARGVSLEGAPLFVSSMAGALAEPDFIGQVVAAINALADEHGPPALIIVDTLARNFGPGRDENSTLDMTTFLANLDLLRSRWPGCSSLIIHHPGQADKTRSRGAYALEAGADCAYLLERDEQGVMRMTCRKMKDAEIPAPRAFRLSVVELGIQDDDGNEITSAVLTETAYEPPAKSGSTGKGKNQTVALEALDRLSGQSGEDDDLFGAGPVRVTEDDWIGACRDAGLNPEQSSKARKRLVDQGVVRKEQGYVSRS